MLFTPLPFVGTQTDKQALGTFFSTLYDDLAVCSESKYSSLPHTTSHTTYSGSDTTHKKSDTNTHNRSLHHMHIYTHVSLHIIMPMRFNFTK